MGRRERPDLGDLLGLTVECRDVAEYEAARADWLERSIGYDTLYFGAAAPEVATRVHVTGVADSYVASCESQADRYWPDRLALNALASRNGGVVFDGEALTTTRRDRMPFYREVTAGLGIRAIAVSVLRLRGVVSRCLYLGRTSRGATFESEIELLRSALPVLAIGAEIHRETPRLDDVPALDRLSPRERQVLDGICRGLTNREIATKLGTSARTVKNQVAAILEKTETTNRTELAALLARTTLRS